MAFNFGSIQEKATSAFQVGAAQAKRVATIAKLKGDNLAQRDALNKAYIAIGKQFYAACDGEVDEAYADAFAQASAALAAIEANNAALQAMKAPEEVLVDVDVEMSAGEMPEDIEADVEAVIEDVADVVETVSEPQVVEEVSVDDPAEENSEE